MPNRLYKIGTSTRRGNLVSVSQDLTSLDKETFFAEIEKSIVHNKLEKHRKDANLIKNLKKGVSLGSDFFKIE